MHFKVFVLRNDSASFGLWQKQFLQATVKNKQKTERDSERIQEVTTGLYLLLQRLPWMTLLARSYKWNNIFGNGDWLTTTKHILTPLDNEDYYENAPGINKRRNRSITVLSDYNTTIHMLCDQRPYFPIPSFMPPLPWDAPVNYTCTSVSLCTGANDRALMNMGSAAVCSIPPLERCYLGHGINLPVSAAADTISAAPS